MRQEILELRRAENRPMGTLDSHGFDNYPLTDESDGPGVGPMYAFDEIQDDSPELTGLAYYNNSHSDYVSGGWGALDD